MAKTYLLTRGTRLQMVRAGSGDAWELCTQAETATFTWTRVPALCSNLVSSRLVIVPAGVRENIKKSRNNQLRRTRLSICERTIIRMSARVLNPAILCLGLEVTARMSLVQLLGLFLKLALWEVWHIVCRRTGEATVELVSCWGTVERPSRSCNKLDKTRRPPRLCRSQTRLCRPFK